LIVVYYWKETVKREKGNYSEIVVWPFNCFWRERLCCSQGIRNYLSSTVNH